MSPNSICSFVAYSAVKITPLQQQETLMGTWRDLPRGELPSSKRRRGGGGDAVAASARGTGQGRPLLRWK